MVLKDYLGCMSRILAGQGLPRLIPTGSCWCGCGLDAAIGAFVAQGHDKKAEAAVLAIHYGGSVPQLLHAYGYGPGHSVTDEAVRRGVWERCPSKGCHEAGTAASIRNHRKKAGH